MTIRTPVHVWLPEQVEPTLAGTFTHDPAKLLGQFEYAETYKAAGHPALAPDMPLRRSKLSVSGGAAVFPVFLDAGPDAWGRHLLGRRLARDVSELEALMLCPTDGVGNIALGELTAARLRVLAQDEFFAVLEEVEAKGIAITDLEEQVLNAAQNGTSLGGTKPKLTIQRDGLQFLAKFPAPGDSRWLPHIECAMLKLARACDVNAIANPEIWQVSPGRAALLVPRFDRVTTAAGTGRRGYVSAHSVLKLNQFPAPKPGDIVQLPLTGVSPQALRKSYVSFVEAMTPWCGGEQHLFEERRELWRRIVFNALIRNLDDHTHNHGLLCHDMLSARQQWKLAPAFDLVPSAAASAQPAFCMAYRYVPANTRKKIAHPRLVSGVNLDDLLAAATEHYGYTADDAKDHLHRAASTVTKQWQCYLAEEGVPTEERARFNATFAFAEEVVRDLHNQQLPTPTPANS